MISPALDERGTEDLKMGVVPGEDLLLAIEELLETWLTVEAE